MKSLADHLAPEHVVWLDDDSGQAPDKDTALSQVLGALSKAEGVHDADELRRAIFSREVLMSTGVGYGVAVPHAKTTAAADFLLGIGISSAGVSYGSALDDDPVRLIVMIVAPTESQEGYLKLLSTTMKAP